MKTVQEIFQLMESNFKDDCSLVVSPNKEELISVSPLKVNHIAEFLSQNEDLLFDSLVLLSGTDDANGKKVNDEDGSFHYEGGTLSVYYHLESIKFRHKLTLKTTVPAEEPNVESVTSVWKAADWHEREAFDMLGIKFLNHPNLIRILMPYDWEDSYPLRKDYKNPEFYKGMKVN